VATCLGTLTRVIEMHALVQCPDGLALLRRFGSWKSTKMRVCIAARAINPRIAIVATSESAAERAWLEEFGAAYVCDALDEMSDAMLRAIRSGV